MRINFIAFGILVAVAASSIWAATASASPAAGASTTQSLSSIMQYLSGSWSCKVLANPNPKKVGTTYKVMRAVESNGVWVTETAGDGRSRYTFDKDTKELWYVYYNDRGNFDVSSSEGWSGNSLVLKNAVRDPRSPDVDATVTFLKLGVAKYDRTFVLTSGNKTLRFEDMCSK